MHPIKIAVTGGPCSGKTTGMIRLQEHLEKLGYRTVVVPETATVIFSGAGRPKTHSRAEFLKYQQAILSTQLALEKTFTALATGDKAVVLTDRSVMDGKAFLTPAEWQALMDDMQLDDYLLLHRYDAVVHLVTAADGARGAYRLEGVRNETPEEAVEQDRALQHAYLGHGHLKIIDNSSDFDEKMRRAVAEICRFLGEPEPLEVERKFLVRMPAALPEDCATSTIEQTYLESTDGNERRVRKRTCKGSSIYSHAQKQVISPGVKIERERSTTGREYLELLKDADPNRLTIRKKRHCFIHDKRVYELDQYKGALDGLWTLEVEVEDMQKPLSFPDWLEVICEVTQDPSYSNAQLALLNRDKALRVMGE